MTRKNPGADPGEAPPAWSYWAVLSEIETRPERIPLSDFMAQTLHSTGQQTVGDVPMKFKVEVGEVEKHQIEFNHNHLLGFLTIKVDKQPVVRMTRLLNEPVREVYEFVVGQMEKSEVRIEKLRRQLFATRNSVYIGNRLVRVFEGV